MAEPIMCGITHDPRPGRFMEHQNWEKKNLENSCFLKMRQFEKENPPKFKMILNGRLSDHTVKS